MATADHSIPTTPAACRSSTQAAAQVQQLETNCREFGIPLHGLGSPNAGHRPCHRAGARADPAGDDDRVRRLAHGHPRRVRGARVRDRDERGRDGPRDPDACSSAARRRTRSGSTGGSRRASRAKDIILALIARIGIGGGTGHVFEYRGEAIRALTMEQRMTICNMSIEGGARAGLIGPDDTTFDYVARPPACAAGRGLGRRGRGLADAADRRRRPVRPVARPRRRALEPMVTCGTNPGMGIAITGRLPRPEDVADERRDEASTTRSSTWASSRASRSPASPSTSCSSARARTAGSATCASPRACSTGVTSPTASG